MKLFTDKNKKLLQYKGFYSFKVINSSETKLNESLSDINNKVLSISPYSSINSNSKFLLEDNYFLKQCQSDLFASQELSIGTVEKASPIKKRNKYIKLSSKQNKLRKTSYNIGRWTEDEHRRFIEAILKHGNEWKAVQRHIKSRSSTQSRSHSQKFFLKIKNYNIFDFKDRKPCISSLNELAKTMSDKEIEEMVKILISYEYCDEINEVEGAFESFVNKKRKKDSQSSNDFDFNDDIATLSFHHNKLPSKLVSLTNTSTKYSVANSIKESETEEEDNFKDEFLNVFTINRKNSFEDNKMTFYYDTIIDKSHQCKSKSHSKSKPIDIIVKDIANSFIEFEADYIIIN